MSHYAVAVFTESEDDDIQELLAPYDENMEVPRYVKYTKRELIDAEKENIQQHDMIERMDWNDEKIYQNAIEEYNFEDIGPDGEIYSTYNPNSKWDWWTIYGRFAGELLLKEEVKHDNDCWTGSARVQDVDFAGMREINRSSLRPYKEFMNDGNQLFSKEYLQREYPDEETYIFRSTEFHTYAVVTPDGKWHAPGEMGWFGCSSETPEEEIEWAVGYWKNFIEPALENNWYITIVDCHI